MTGNITMPTVSSTAGILKGNIGGLNLQSNRSGDMGILGTFNGGSNFGFQLYASTGNYGFLDAAWASWDIQKAVNGAFSVDEGSGLKRVLNEANWTSYVTTSTFAASSHTHSYLPLTGGAMTGNISFPAGQNITRTTHSSGFLEGSYNNVGGNSAKSCPIYTIGSA